LPESIADTFKGVHTLIYNKYFVDEFYDATVVEPVVGGSRQLLWRIGDVRLIDGIANGIGTTARGAGGILRRAQSGYIRNYAAWVLAGTILAMAYIGFMGASR
jgi:NADH-quinone oxidoreductase subunit L